MSWNNTETSLWPVNINKVTDTLPVGVYKLHTSLQGIYVTHHADSFQLPEVMYNINQSLLDRVVKYTHHADRNVGVLFNGLKGSGKTVALKQICNRLQYPVFIVDDPDFPLSNFLDYVKQPCVLFFDEFEKMFPKDNGKTSSAQNRLLSLMDGANQGSQIVWMFSCNDMFVSDAMVSRPGRVRYVAEFEGLNVNDIRLIVDARLVNRVWLDELVDVVQDVDRLTVDGLTAFVDEVNLFNLSPKVLFEGFNLVKKKVEYDYFLCHPLFKKPLTGLTGMSFDDNYWCDFVGVDFQVKLGGCVEGSMDVRGVKNISWNYPKLDVFKSIFSSMPDWVVFDEDNDFDSSKVDYSEFTVERIERKVDKWRFLV
jgi:ATPase family associated with various cellular activities (AAA)